MEQSYTELEYTNELFNILTDMGGTYTFTHEQPQVSAYLPDAQEKGFAKALMQVYVWSLYINGLDIMMHVYDHLNDDMHSTNINVTDVASADMDNVIELIKKGAQDEK